MRSKLTLHIYYQEEKSYYNVSIRCAEMDIVINPTNGNKVLHFPSKCHSYVQFCSLVGFSCCVGFLAATGTS